MINYLLSTIYFYKSHFVGRNFLQSYVVGKREKQRKLVSKLFPSKYTAVNFGCHFCQLKLQLIENLTKTNKMCHKREIYLQLL